MTDLFRTVLNMSITGAYIAAAIIILRLFMRKLPKKYSYLLWVILGIRLLCPVSFSSAVSLFNVLVPEKPEISSGQMEYIPQDIEYSYEPKVTVSVPPVNDTVNTYLPPAEPNNSVNPMQVVMLAASAAWICGMSAMVIYTVISYFAVKKRIGKARESGDVFISDNIETPFVFGIVKPRIYLPENISEEDMRYIIAHEQTHIRRGDHIVKLIAMAALCVHWFNPMVWISYRLMTKDMELSCDEKALGTFDEDVKKAYANALLNISMRQNKLTLGGVLSFGESDIKSRIKGVLGAKKPKVIVTIIAVIAVIIAAVCLLTNAVKKDKEFAPIAEGVYVTDKLLYRSPYSSLFMGDSNGMRYSIKDGMLTMSGTLILDGESTYKLSEPMEIPFTDAEWDEAFWDADTGDGVAWHGGRKRLSDYTEKYCFALESDYDGGYELYLFVMDDELWYVTYGWEIYRLKQMNTSPVDAARAYLNGKNITDEKISELTVSQYSFYNEGWKYTISPLSLKYGVNDGDNVVEVTATYKIDFKEVHTIIITAANETGFRVLDEVNYLPREFTAVISEVHGNEDVTGYEWQKYVIIPDEDSYGFTKGEATLVFSRPYYGNDFLNVGDKVRVNYSGEPVTSLTLVGFEQPAYYFLHMTSLQEDIAVETQPDENNETTEENAENTFQTVSRKQRPMIPDEYGGYNIDNNTELIDVSFAVPAEWTSNGYGIFMLGEEKVLEQNIIYSDSYGLLTEGFTVDMVSGREIKTIDEKYGDENDPYRYYIHTSMQSYDGVYDHHSFVIQQNGYYVAFCFNDSENFNMATAEAILSTVTVSPVYLDINLDSMQAASSIIDIGTLQSDGTIKTTGEDGAAEVSFFLPDVWFTNDIPGMYYNKNMFNIESVYKTVPNQDYSALNGTNGTIPIFGREVNVMGESYAVEGGNSPYDYMVHKTVNGSECYEYVVTRGEYSAVVHFNADPSSTEIVRNAIIKSIKIEKVGLSDVQFEDIDFSASYDSPSMIVTMSITNNSNREFVAFDEGIEIYENGEYVPVSFFSLNAEEKTSMHIWGGEGLEYYQTMGEMANPEFKSGEYRAVITGYFSDAPDVRSMIYAGFEIE